jgi:FKBP-type peptidyl-prolyl cis-trans isomerase 2
MDMHPAKVGDRVRVEYSRIRKQKSASQPEPKVLEFTVGSLDIMPGLSFGVVGMAPGEQKHFTLQPADAYGVVQPGLIKEIPRGQFPKRLILRVGKRLTALAGASGRRRRVRIVEIKPKSVVVDGNHVLAGKVVELEVTLLSVDATASARHPATHA